MVAEISMRRKELFGRSFNLIKFLVLLSLATLMYLGSFLFSAPSALPSSDGQSTQDCQVCHEEIAKTFALNPHRRENCTSCHKPAEKHLENPEKGNILGFSPAESTNQKVGPCLSCHHASLSQYAMSQHNRSNLDCTTCHSVHHASHSSLLATAKNTVCSSCHQDIESEFNLNERHRLREGILECTSCHNPHEPAFRERLGGFKQETCLKCHMDKGGPFLFEHGASRVEGCTSCHVAHGSPNRHLLNQASIADLCFSCHTLAPAWHSRFTSLSTNCTTCHVSIHGSNLSRIFIK